MAGKARPTLPPLATLPPDRRHGIPAAKQAPERRGEKRRSFVDSYSGFALRDGTTGTGNASGGAIRVLGETFTYQQTLSADQSFEAS
jgi:hypothetical protein